MKHTTIVKHITAVVVILAVAVRLEVGMIRVHHLPVLILPTAVIDMQDDNDNVQMPPSQFFWWLKTTEQKTDDLNVFSAAHAKQDKQDIPRAEILKLYCAAQVSQFERDAKKSFNGTMLRLGAMIAAGLIAAFMVPQGWVYSLFFLAFAFYELITFGQSQRYKFFVAHNKMTQALLMEELIRSALPETVNMETISKKEEQKLIEKQLNTIHNTYATGAGIGIAISNQKENK